MAKIKFHCEHCNKEVAAPEGSGGKMGRCPYCKQQCYIPLPREQVTEIPLEPVDPAEEQRRRKLLHQTLATQQELMKHNKVAGEAAADMHLAPETALPIS